MNYLKVKTANKITDKKGKAKAIIFVQEVEVSIYSVDKLVSHLHDKYLHSVRWKCVVDLTVHLTELDMWICEWHD